MRSWYAIRAREAGAEVMIYDEIGAFGVSAKSFLDELAALPEAAELTLRLNSPGGSVFDAVAIHNALSRRPGGVTVWIDGIAASAASYVAMAGREVVMPENAFLMIHDPSGAVMGSADEMRAMAEALDKIKTSLVAGYAAKSGAAEEDVAALMARETWLDAREAQARGFADRVAEPAPIAASFDIGRFRNAPPKLIEAVEAAEAEEGEAPPEETPEPEAEPAPDEEGSGADAEPPPASPDDAAIRAEAMAHARAVLDLCALAGMPERAAGFLEAATPLAEVRAQLLAARAEAGPDPDPHHPQPGGRVDAQPWTAVIARTFKRKG